MNDTDTPMRGDAVSLEQQPAGQSPIALPESAGMPSADPPNSEAEIQGAARQHRTVPYGALAEERARRKELQRELQSAVEAQQKLQGRLDLLHELAQQQAGAVAGGGAEASQEDMSDPQPETPKEIPVAADVDAEANAAFRTQLMHSVRDAMRERPDFMAAYQHARQARVAELCALGYSPDEALGITFDNELEIIQSAYANGRNPAQVIYDYARRRGYGGPQATSPGRSAAAARAGNLSEAEKVALAARGQAASKSLSTAGGGSTGALSLEALAGMSDEEFAEATKGDRWQKLLK